MDSLYKSILSRPATLRFRIIFPVFLAAVNIAYAVIQYYQNWQPYDFYFLISSIFILGIWIALHLLIKKKQKLWAKPQSVDLILEMARERQERINEYIRSERNYQYLFLETPPENETINFSDEVSRNARLAQTIKLNWQTDSPELLLGERLVDTLVYFLTGSNENPFPFPSIRLEYDQQQQHTFPWIAVIETDFPSYFKDLLSKYKNWLAIGIRFAPAVSFKNYARCSASGNDGIAGGLLTDTGKYGACYAMTCSHVVVPDCGSLAEGAFPTGSDSLPDAALLRLGSACFNLAQVKGGFLQTAEHTLIDFLMTGGGRVNKILPGKTDVTGIIIGRGIAYVCDNKVVRFPNLDIKLYSYYQFGIKFPFLKRNFSRPGESGSWVIEPKTNTWLGMITVGDPDTPVCKIQEAGPLLAYFSLITNLNFQPQSINHA